VCVCVRVCDSIQRRPCPGPGPSTALGGWAGRLVGWLVATGRKNKLSFQQSPPPQHVSVDRTAAVLLINLLAAAAAAAAAATHTHTRFCRRLSMCVRTKDRTAATLLCVCVCVYARGAVQRTHRS